MPRGLRLSAPHVLVVDTDPAERSAIAAMLAAEGARITMAASSGEAMRHVAARRFDAAVVDYAVPTLGGIVLVAQFRGCGNGRDVPVVVLHALLPGSKRDRAAERAAHLSGVVFLARPVTGQDLAAALNGVTSRV